MYITWFFFLHKLIEDHFKFVIYLDQNTKIYCKTSDQFQDKIERSLL